MKRLDGSDFFRDCSDDPRYFTVTSTSNTSVWDTVTGAETASRRCLIFGEQRRTSVDQAAVQKLGSGLSDRRFLLESGAHDEAVSARGLLVVLATGSPGRGQQESARLRSARLDLLDSADVLDRLQQLDEVEVLDAAGHDAERQAGRLNVEACRREPPRHFRHAPHRGGPADKDPDINHYHASQTRTT